MRQRNEERETERGGVALTVWPSSPRGAKGYEERREGRRRCGDGVPAPKIGAREAGFARHGYASGVLA